MAGGVDDTGFAWAVTAVEAEGLVCAVADAGAAGLDWAAADVDAAGFVCATADMPISSNGNRISIGFMRLYENLFMAYPVDETNATTGSTGPSNDYLSEHDAGFV